MTLLSKLSALAYVSATAMGLSKEFTQEDIFSNDIDDTTLEPVLPAYSAAVLEHICTYDDAVSDVDGARAVINANLAVIETNIQEIATLGAEIILLPEFALTGLVDTRDKMTLYLESVGETGQGEDSTPCNNDDFSDRPTLQQLSCIATENTVYLVVNYGDVVDCDSATDDDCEYGFYQYNTEIVFSDSGEIVAKYWNIHTFEVEFDSPSALDFVTFDFKGLKFGLFTCYDSMFATPIINLLASEGVNDMVISHWWSNDYPRMAAVNWFESVSRQYNINLLVAGSGWNKDSTTPKWSSGSGIFSRGDVVAQYYNRFGNDDDTYLIGDVFEAEANAKLNPKHQGVGGGVDEIPAPMEYTLVSQEASSNAEITLEATVSETAYSPEFTCKAEAKLEYGDDSGETYMYLYAATGYYEHSDNNGVYFFEKYCSLYVCKDGASNNDCWTPNEEGYDDSNIGYEYATVSGNFDMKHVFPMALDGSGYTYYNILDQSEITQTDDEFSFTLTSAHVEESVLSVTLLGRDFSRDVKYTAADTPVIDTTQVILTDDDVETGEAVAANSIIAHLSNHTWLSSLSSLHIFLSLSVAFVGLALAAIYYISQIGCSAFKYKSVSDFAPIMDMEESNEYTQLL